MVYVCFCLCTSQISQKKLKKYEKEYHTIREQQEQQEAPIERYEVNPSLSSVCEHKLISARIDTSAFTTVCV